MAAASNNSAAHGVRCFWVAIVGPLIGGVIGVLIYDWFIGDVLYAKARLAEPASPGRAGDEQPPAAEQGTAAEA